MFGFKRKSKKLFLHSRNAGVRRRAVTYSNPVKVRKRTKRFQIFKYINILLGVVIIGSLYFFFISSYFAVRNIEVNGTMVIAPDDIIEITNRQLSEKRFGLFRNTNIFLFSKEGLRKAVARHFILDDLEITKVLPDTLKLTVREKIAAMQWNSDGQKFLLDTEGLIIKEVFSSSSPYKVFQLTAADYETATSIPVHENGFLNIQNRGGEEVSLGSMVITGDQITFIQNAYEQLENKNFFETGAITVPHAFPQSVNFETTEGWSVILNLNDELEKQLERFDLVIQNKIGMDNVSKLEYIDLKLGESVYYKFKEGQ